MKDEQYALEFGERINRAVEALVASVLSKEQEEAVERITKTNDRLKTFWNNNFEKIRKEALAEHCFELFECLEMMLVSIDKAAEVQKLIKEWSDKDLN